MAKRQNSAASSHSWPNEAELKKIRTKLSNPRYKSVSKGLPEDASLADRTKYGICREILLFKQTKDLTNRDLAKLLGCAETRVSEVLHYHIEKFTLDRLVGYLEKLKPLAKLKVA